MKRTLILLCIISISSLIGCQSINQDSNTQEVDNSMKCKPLWEIKGGPELTAHQNYVWECTKQTNKEDCESIDIYRSATDDFVQGDGNPDCEWS